MSMVLYGNRLRLTGTGLHFAGVLIFNVDEMIILLGEWK